MVVLSVNEPAEAKRADAFILPVLESLKSCPAFKDVYPLGVDSGLQAISDVIMKMPTSHAAGGSAANKVLLDALEAMHAERKRLGDKPCPVFDQSGPFKQCRLELEARAGFIPRLERKNSWAQATDAENDTVPDVQGGIVPEPSEPTSDIFLSKLLKMGTQDAHKAAESGTFVKRLLRGKVPPEEYRNFLVDLCHVYEALESSLQVAAEEKQSYAIQAIHHPIELTRLGSLQQDLDYWFRNEPEARAAAAPSDAAQVYAARIRELVQTAPHLLVAHAYTRYLGDLSGGAFIKRSICRAMPVGSDGEGVRFYDFEKIPDAKSFKQKYRDELDSLDVPATIADAIVQEANIAFDLNTAVFRHLDNTSVVEAPPTIPKHMKLPDGHPPVPVGHPPVPKEAGNVCPFLAMAMATESGETAAGAKKRPTTPMGALKATPAAAQAVTPKSRKAVLSWGSLKVLAGVILVMPLAISMASGI